MIFSSFPYKHSNFVLFKTANGKVYFDINIYYEGLCLWQKLINKLFQKYRSEISKQLKNIFEECKHDDLVVCGEFAHAIQQEQVSCYKQLNITAFRYCAIQDKHYIMDFNEEVKELIGKDREGTNDGC